MDGRPTGTLRLELHYRLDAATANGRMLGVLAGTRFPVPAALAFLPISINPAEGKIYPLLSGFAVDFKSKL